MVAVWLLAGAALGILTGLGKAAADAQAHGSPGLARWFPKWAGPESWRNKYRERDPAKGPAFPGAQTWLVGFTDLWHAANLLAGAAADGAVVLAVAAGKWPFAVGYVVARRVSFEPMYTYLRT